MINNHKNPGRFGFTLIELLVVVAIIALLIGILLPSLSKARAVSRQAACLSQLKGIGTSLASYATEYDDRRPGTAVGSGGDLTGAFEKYLSADWDSGIWECTDYPEFVQSAAMTSSYGYNWQYLLEPGPGYPYTGYTGFSQRGQKTSNLKRPSTSILFMDQERPEGIFNLWTYLQRPSDSTDQEGLGRPGFRHLGNTAVLFNDYHGGVLEEEPVTDPARESEHWDPR